MEDLVSLRRRAIAHMRTALALLDEAGEQAAACHLQMAHDIVARIPPMQQGNEVPEGGLDQPNLTTDPSLVRAIGGALAVFATLLSRAGVGSIEEIANTLGVYAAVSSQASRQEGLIIGCWSAILHDVAETQRKEE